LSSFNAWYAGRVSPLPPDLRRALDPYDVVTGPRDLGGELALVVRVGAVDVELALRGVSATASAATTIGGVYLDLDRALAPPDHLRSNDPAYARWLVVDARGLIDPLLADGGRARLQLGRWRVEHPSPGSLRRVLELTARLALAPRHLAERWAALASALGGAWAGTWGTRGETRFVVGTGATALAIEARLRDDGLAVTRLAGERGALEVPLTLAPAEVVAIAGRLGVALTVRAAGPTAIAPLPIASWPSARGGDGGRGPRERTTTGADARPGLDERLVIDGVEVATRCAADLRAATAIAAEAPGARALRVTARPGYRFLRSLFIPEPRLGDAAFDDRYVLEVNDLAWARWWLGPDERDAISATFDPEAAAPFGFALEDGRAGFRAEAAPSRRFIDAARLGAAFLAGRGDRATREWRALAAVLGGTTTGAGFAVDGGLAIRTGRGALTIEIATARLAETLCTMARAGTAGAEEAHRLTVISTRAPDGLADRRGRGDPEVPGPAHHVARASDPTWAAARLAALAPVLAAAQPDRVELRGPEARVIWAGPMLDARRLTAGVELIARVARADPGAIATPYR
jgi:hypothetical protein